MKAYVSPEMEQILLVQEDVLTLSGNPIIEKTEGGSDVVDGFGSVSLW